MPRRWNLPGELAEPLARPVLDAEERALLRKFDLTVARRGACREY